MKHSYNTSVPKYEVHIAMVFVDGKWSVEVTPATFGAAPVLPQSVANEAIRKATMHLSALTKTYPFQDGGPGGGRMPVPKEAKAA
jgi:hypothetical protein